MSVSLTSAGTLCAFGKQATLPPVLVKVIKNFHWKEHVFKIFKKGKTSHIEKSKKGPKKSTVNKKSQKKSNKNFA